MDVTYTDMGFLRENTFNNTGTMRDLIQIFLETTPEMITELKDAADVFKVDQISATAHKLRSSYSTMGVAIADPILANLENDTYELGKSGVISAINDLEKITAEVNKELLVVVNEL